MIMPSDRPDWMGEEEDAAEEDVQIDEGTASITNCRTICRCVSVCVGVLCLSGMAIAWMRRQ